MVGRAFVQRQHHCACNRPSPTWAPDPAGRRRTSLRPTKAPRTCERPLPTLTPGSKGRERVGIPSRHSSRSLTDSLVTAHNGSDFFTGRTPFFNTAEHEPRPRHRLDAPRTPRTPPRVQKLVDSRATAKARRRRERRKRWGSWHKSPANHHVQHCLSDLIAAAAMTPRRLAVERTEVPEHGHNHLDAVNEGGRSEL